MKEAEANKTAWRLLAKAGLAIEFFNKYDTLYFDMGDMEKSTEGEYHFQFFDKKMPFTFSLKAGLINR